MITCRNPLCGVTFETPLKALSLQNSAETCVCPCCLAAITESPKVDESPEIKVQLEPLNVEPEPELETTLAPENQPQEMQKEDAPKTLDCRHYLGYLSEKERKGQIPEECIICKNIVECMLQKMRT